MKKTPVKKLFASLDEELRNSGYSSFGTKDNDYESSHDDGSSDKQNDSKKSRKSASRTPTDFSEAETSSSGLWFSSSCFSMGLMASILLAKVNNSIGIYK